MGRSDSGGLQKGSVPGRVASVEIQIVAVDEIHSDNI